MSLQSSFHAEGGPSCVAPSAQEPLAAAQTAAHGEVAVTDVLDDAHQAIAGRMACRQLRFHVVNRVGAARVAGSRRLLVDAFGVISCLSQFAGTERTRTKTEVVEPGGTGLIARLLRDNQPAKRRRHSLF